MEDFEPSLIEGYLLCLCNAEAIRSQSSQWKRKLLFFMSGVAVEIAAVPFLSSLLGYDFSWAAWLLTAVFLPLGALIDFDLKIRLSPFFSSSWLTCFLRLTRFNRRPIA